MKSSRTKEFFGIAALSVCLAFAGGAAQAQDCGAAMPAFATAMKTGTAEALSGYLDAHSPCFEVPARARLTALGGAPAPAPEPTPAPVPEPAPVITTSPAYTPAPESVPAPGDTSCQTYAQAKSVRWDQPLVIRVTNQSGQRLSISWIDYEGVPQPYGALDAGGIWEQQTFITHPFSFTADDGSCVQIVMPELGVADYYIAQ